VVDASTLRRGSETANAIWGNSASVLVGDFLLSRAFQMIVKVGDMRVTEVLSNATNTLAEGEILQLINCNDAETTIDQYMDVIKRKTAVLFEAAAKLGGIIAKRSEPEIELIARYGLHLGIAFQLIDDALDYHANEDTLGKNIGDDLAEGKPTLPLIHALLNGNEEQKIIIKNAIENNSIENLDAVLTVIQETNAIEYTYEQAKQHVELALDALTELPESKFKQALNVLASFNLQRQH